MVMEINMKNVMIIDDSKPIRTQVRNFFEPLGFTVMDANNGEDALKKIEENPSIALFVVDVNMPVINGLEFCKILRSKANYKDTPVIMLTTESGVDLIDEARQFGVKAWILKPFEPGPLTKALELIGIKSA
jgi:two-component system chemotaxis response regulator CheY